MVYLYLLVPSLKAIYERNTNQKTQWKITQVCVSRPLQYNGDHEALLREPVLYDYITGRSSAYISAVSL